MGASHSSHVSSECVRLVEGQQESSYTNESEHNMAGELHQCECSLGNIRYDGELHFRGIKRDSKAKYIHLLDQTEPEEAWGVMKEKWKMNNPTMMLSVIGGARAFYLDNRIEASLKSTILKVSQLPDSFIITGGAYSGVMKLVGETLQEAPSGVCLGISTWSEIMKREVIGNADKKQPYVVGSWLTKDGLYLDYQHTHFIIVEEESADGMGQTRFRAKLEQYIKNVGHAPLYRLNTSLSIPEKSDPESNIPLVPEEVEEHVEQTRPIPSVLLVVNGGFGTLDCVLEYIQRIAGPVVVVQKSGKAADLLAYGVRHWEEIRESKDQYQCDVGLYEEMRRHLVSKDDEEAYIKQKLDNYYPKLIECLEQSNLFTVAGVGSETDIETAVLSGLLFEDEKNTFKKMELSLLWDRVDFARSNIFNKRPNVTDEELDKLMIMALAHGQHEYAQLLMDYGVNMNKLLTKERLAYLYSYQAYEDHFPLTKFIHDYLSVKDVDLLGKMKSRGQNERPLLPLKMFQKILKTKLCDRLTKVEIIQCNDSKDSTFQDPFWELFMWSVLCNMPQMAQFLWPFGKNQMAKALIAAEILEVVAGLDVKYKQATASLVQASNEFKQLAQDLLDEMSAKSEEDTRILCTTTLCQVPDTTCLDIAYMTNNYQYVAHNSIQMILMDVWTGFWTTRKVQFVDYLKVLFSILFPFMIIHYLEDEEKENASYSLKKKKNFSIEKDEDEKKQQKCTGKFIDVSKNLWKFYFHTPIVTFILHVFVNILFLGLFSYVVITASVKPRKDFKEILLALYVLGHVIGELYQIHQYDGNSYITNTKSWISDPYNRFDLFNIVLFCVAWFMSFHNSLQSVSHTLLAINCGFWIIRSFSFLRIISTLGLYIEMISTMLVQLTWFLLILGVNTLAFGVTSTAILYPGNQEPIIYLQMFMRSWFGIYGEYFLEIEPENNATTHLTTPRLNSYDEYVAWVLLGVYLLIMQILLLNIIIAAFNTTYSNIEEQSTYISQYRKYDLVVEYSKRVSSPPPLSLLHHLFLALRWVVRCVYRLCSEKTENEEEVTKLRLPLQFLKENQLERLKDFEYYCTVKVIKANARKSNNVMENLSDDIAKKLELMDDDVSSSDMLQRLNSLESTMCLVAEKVDTLLSRFTDKE